MILQKVIMDDDNPLFEYMMNNLGVFQSKFDKKTVISTAENIIMFSLYSSRGNQYSVSKVAEVKRNLAKLGVDATSIQGRIWNAEASALFRAGKNDEGFAVIDSLLKSQKTVGSKEYVFLCNFVKARTNDPKTLQKTARWCQMSK
jgi:hypothetical protein